MREHSQVSNERLQKIGLLKSQFPIFTAKDLIFSKQSNFPFECDDQQLFFNFEITSKKMLLSPCLLYIPLNEEDITYDTSFLKYKDSSSSLINRVLVMKIFKLHELKGLQLKYLSFRIEVLFI